MKKLVYLAIIASLLQGTAAGATGLKVGSKAPNLVGRTIEGKLYRLSKDVGAPKVINFFWVYCKPCKEEMPELAKLESMFPDVKFISVHTEKMGKGKVQSFLDELEAAPSNIILATKSVKKQFKYMGLPYTIVLDSDNVVRLTFEGYTKGNMDKLKIALKELSN